MMEKTARIQDVARVAGVSTATVSRALSNPDLLSDTTREAVFDAIRQTGYRANRAARNLRQRRAGAALIAVPNLGNPFFSEILSGISARLARSEYSVLITDTTNRTTDADLANFFLDARVDGMISLDGSISKRELARLEGSGASGRIVFACEWTRLGPYPSVRSDNEAGARLAIRHLHDLGHRDIGHVTGPAGNVLTGARRDGMLAERAALGVPARDDWIIRGDFSLASGHAAARRIAAMAHRPTAMFCASDMVAFGLISGLAEAGLDVPGDMSVVGFDDIEMTGFYVPGLTTIRQDRHRLGRRAAEILLDRFAHPDRAEDSARADLIDVELVRRASTRAVQ